MTHFCHIIPTSFLEEFVAERPYHLLLAHLVEEDPAYTAWYQTNKEKYPDTVYILDNSAFEMYKQGRSMYPSDKLVEMGKLVNADYIVLSDYPGAPASKTIDAAVELAPVFREAGFGTFFVPQSRVGCLEELIQAYQWAVGPEGRQYVDYIGVSILGVPNGYGVEKDNKLQRFNSRWSFMRELYTVGILDQMRDNAQKLHFLGMVDGPAEIALVEAFLPYIDTWDSSAAVWAGLNGIGFDESPTGLINGKFEKEVEFDLRPEYLNNEHMLEDDLELAHRNISIIENYLDASNSLTRLQTRA